RRDNRAPAIGAVRLGAASENAHHHVKCEDCGVCRQPAAGQRRHFDRHLGRKRTRHDPRTNRGAIGMSMRFLAALLLLIAAALPAAAQVAPTEAELRAYGGLHAAAARGDVAEIERRIAAGENKEAVDSRQRTPLHVAVYWKQHDAARA